MNKTSALRIGAIFGFLAVGLGAFGAHGLKEVLARHGTAATWETAVFYHFIHALVIFVLAVKTSRASGPWWCFVIGTIIFSGTLYVLALTNLRWLGAITPLGGLSLLLGWGWLAVRPSLVVDRPNVASPSEV